MLERINAARAAHGLPPLAESAALAQAARDHAADLSRNEWLIESRRWHEGSDGSSISGRLIRAGYRGARWRENVCLLYTSPSPRDRTRSRMPSSA